MTEPISVPEAITFNQGIEVSQALIEQTQQGQISTADIEATVAKLVSTVAGARGFFVAYLTDDRPLADSPSTAVIRALQASPEIVADLLVKNLAMSTATAIAHRRNQNEPMAQGSDRVQFRTANLMQQLNLAPVWEKARQLQSSLETDSGDYKAFLDRNGYDAEQRQQIQQQIAQVLGAIP